MSEYNADFLLEKQQVWVEIFSQNLNFIEKGFEWHKVIVHEIPIISFLISDGLSILKNEIETFNPNLKLLRNPKWLSSEENRQNKKHGSIVFAIENTEQAKKITEQKLYIAGSQLIAENYEEKQIKKSPISPTKSTKSNITMRNN